MNQFRLFLACFFALIATAFGFIIRAMIMDQWAVEFGLSETQKGEIFGVGLWPFAVSIVLFSLVIDRIGYGKAMIFALLCHVTSAIVTICAPMVLAGEGASAEAVTAGRAAGYWMLYLGNFIVALGNGTVEAVINPVVATIFSKQKTKWLNILHAGWPGGLVLGGLILLALNKDGGMFPVEDWRIKVALIFIPVAIYALLLIGCKFPVSERVAAGVSYRDMLAEFGILGAFVVGSMIVFEVARVFEGMGLIFQGMDDTTKLYIKLGISAAAAAAFGVYVRSLGRPMFIFLLLIMIPLATTELGTDSWIGDLMTPEMQKLGLAGGWVLVYTSAIMMILRFFAGPIVHRFSPLGLLATSAVLAALGLVFLSRAEGVAILAAATLYGFGKTFFWPTMLGVVAEQFPKGGALTLNATGGVGMLAVGVVGAAFLGYIQDTTVNRELQVKEAAMYQTLVSQKQSVFGSYEAVDPEKKKSLTEQERTTLTELENAAKKQALARVAIFPVIMFVCYMILILYFKAKGGYTAQVLAGHAAEDQKFTGGIAGPVEA